MSLDYTPNEIARFWSKVKLPEQIGTDECWLWQASTNQDGYGRIWMQGRLIQATHFVFILVNGDIPSGLEIMHICDNPRCCNPDHLIAGTHLENIRDMLRKNRWIAVKGEKNGQAVINEDQARMILKSDKPQVTIARELGVSVQIVYRVKHRKTWRHISV